MKQRVYKSTSEDREGDLVPVNVILEPTVCIASPFACLPSLSNQAGGSDTLSNQHMSYLNTHEIQLYTFILVLAHDTQASPTNCGPRF